MQLVSVAMATYNGEKYIRQQLDSILDQSYKNIEVIVVDDFSTDNTFKTLCDYAAKDERIKIFSNKINIGVVATFEKCLGLTTGDFIALCDQDDIFRKDKIELMVRAFEMHPQRDLVLSDLSLIDAENKEIAQSLWRYQNLKPEEGKPFRRLVYSNFATGCGMMISRRLLSFCLPFAKNIHMHDWWIAVVSTTTNAGGIHLLTEKLTAYRQHGANVLGAKEAKSLSLKTSSRRLKRALTLSYDQRYMSKVTDISRLDGYLTKDIWSASERQAIVEIRSLKQGYIDDRHSSFFKRLVSLPRRLNYAVRANGFSSIIPIIFFSFWPPK